MENMKKYDLSGLSEEEKRIMISKIWEEQIAFITNNGRKRLHVPMIRKGTSKKKKKSRKVLLLDETHLLFNQEEILKNKEAYLFPEEAIEDYCKRARKYNNFDDLAPDGLLGDSFKEIGNKIIMREVNNGRE